MAQTDPLPYPPPPPAPAAPSWWERNRESIDNIAKLLILLLSTFSGWMAMSASRDAGKARDQSEKNAGHLRYVSDKADANHAAVEDLRRNAKVIMYGPEAKGKE